ncbi:hypothetical protein LINPERPRIM_LOCUS28100 [Linum perenne]|jgi:hypothetical protein
MSPR